MMAEKKDPGKFTVRFNVADPQQRTVIELLNQQGRYKAQFLTSAILHYVHCSETPDIRGVPAVGSEEIESMIRKVLAQQQNTSPQAPVQEIRSPAAHYKAPANQTEGADRDAIFKTLEAFSQQ